ncbi:MAG: hypothetical protein GY754_34095 [bacterium]|nr:hypothetical protein [bacterium]
MKKYNKYSKKQVVFIFGKNILKMSPEERKQYERYLSNLASEKDIIDGAHDDGV